jgi:hypothetical protein
LREAEQRERFERSGAAIRFHDVSAGVLSRLTPAGKCGVSYTGDAAARPPAAWHEKPAQWALAGGRWQTTASRGVNTREREALAKAKVFSAVEHRASRQQSAA